jgi:hypothetical protein
VGWFEGAAAVIAAVAIFGALLFAINAAIFGWSLTSKLNNLYPQLPTASADYTERQLPDRVKPINVRIVSEGDPSRTASAAPGSPPAR